MMRNVNKAVLLCGISMVTLHGAANAQGAPAVAEPAKPAPASSNALESIVVTANKREQRLNEVGLTVSVVSGKSLKARQINSLADLAQTVPGLSYTNTQNGTPVYTLRGVGFYEASLGAYPTVSSYLDEVPLAFPVLTTHTAYDLARVEVLKGPQGTLFGQNATGGAINYVTAKPTSVLSGGVNLSYGRFNQVISEGYISGPVSDNLRIRVAGRTEDADGWQQSNTRPGDTNGKLRNYMGRLLVDYDPTADLHFLLNVNGSTDGSQPEAPQFIGLVPQQPILDPAVANAHFSPQRPTAADWTPGVPYADNRTVQVSLRSDYKPTDDLKLTALTAYIDYKQHQGEDEDGLPASTLDIFNDYGRIQSFSQEVRLANSPSDRFRWVVGGNYERSTVDEIVDLHFPNSSTHEVFSFIGYNFGATFTNTQQKMTNWANFANGEYDVLPNVTLKGGVRYTNAEVDAHICNQDRYTQVGNFFYNVLLGGAFGPYAGQCFSINNNAATIGGVPPGSPGAFKGTLHQDNVSWRGGVDWKLRPGLLLYGLIAKGFKAGSFPALSGSLFSQYDPVTQESVLAYEGGFKASLLQDKLQFNGAGFYYDYSDKQLRSKVYIPPFGILDTLQNIPKSTIKGFEMDATGRPLSGLIVNTAFTYLDAVIDKYEGINAAGLTSDFAGSRVPFTPKFQLGVNADYDFPLTSHINGFVGSSFTFRSNTVSIIGGDENPPNARPAGASLFLIDSYSLLDLRAGIHSADDRWRFTVWGKNVLNTYYWNNTVAVFDTVARYAGMPATYGAALSLKF